MLDRIPSWAPCALLLAPGLSAHPQGASTWTVSLPEMDSAFELVELPTGQLAGLGRIQSRYHVLELSADGLVQRQYEVPVGSARQLEVLANGTIAMLGSEFRPSNGEMGDRPSIRTSQNLGSQLWGRSHLAFGSAQTTFGGEGGAFTDGCPTADGGAIAGGTVSNIEDFEDFAYLASYAGDGAVEWVREMSRGSVRYVGALGGDEYVVVIDQFVVSGVRYLRFLRIDGDGEILHQQAIFQDAPFFGEGAILTGNRFLFTTGHGSLVEMDTQFQVVEAHRLVDPFGDEVYPRVLTPLPDGGFVLAVTYDGVVDNDAAVLRFDAQGQIVWQRLLTNIGGIFETVTSLSTAANGDLLLAGTLDNLIGFGSTGFLARMSPSGQIEGCDLLDGDLFLEDIIWNATVPGDVVPLTLSQAGLNPVPPMPVAPAEAVGICLGAGPGIDTYCTSLPNSSGQPARIAAVGSTSITANDLALVVDDLPAGQPGIFIAGPTQANLPFGNGFLCIAPTGLQRFAQVTTPQAGRAVALVDLASSAPGGLNVVTGQSFHYQRWNRDVAAGGVTFSDALEVAYTP